jgi:hypothetical protein
MFDGIIVGNSSPGSGTIPTLQQVTDSGNTTTNKIICTDTTGGEIDIDASSQGVFIYDNLGSIKTILVNSDVVVFGDLGYFIELFSSGSNQYLVYLNNGQRLRVSTRALNSGFDRSMIMPDANSVTVIPFFGSFTEVVGVSVYNIPHGFTFTPTCSSITPQSINAAKAISGGCWLTFDATNIIVNLVVPSVSTTLCEFSFFMSQ